MKIVKLAACVFALALLSSCVVYDPYAYGYAVPEPVYAPAPPVTYRYVAPPPPPAVIVAPAPPVIFGGFYYHGGGGHHGGHHGGHRGHH